MGYDINMSAEITNAIETLKKLSDQSDRVEAMCSRINARKEKIEEVLGHSISGVDYFNIIYQLIEKIEEI